MKEQVVSLVDKVCLQSKINSLELAAQQHIAQIHDIECTGGIFISQSEGGTVCWDVWGLNSDEVIALLEKAKHTKLKDMFG